MNLQFKEILFNRVSVQDGENLNVSFERVREIKEVKITQAEADILNAGKLTSPGNISFTYLVKDGEDDPGLQVLTPKKASSKTVINPDGSLYSGSEIRQNGTGPTVRSKKYRSK